MSAHTRAPRAHGFTLIELMVALFITAIMFAIGYGELEQALKSRQEVEQQSARMLAIQHAVRTIEQDFELLQPRSVRNLVGDGYLPALIAGSNNGQLINSGGSSSSLNTATPLVTFTRGGWTNPVGVERGELQRVSYAVQNGTLVREYWPVLDATLEDTVISRVLLDHVKGFSLRFMDAGHQWQTQWPAPSLVPGQQNLLLRSRPIAVEVTIQLDDWGVLVRDIEVAG
jgi:general secretion pathway protein J